MNCAAIAPALAGVSKAEAELLFRIKADDYNASVMAARARLADAGMAGKLSLLRSDGGLMSALKAEEHPVNILMSGPAGGVTGARRARTCVRTTRFSLTAPEMRSAPRS